MFYRFINIVSVLFFILQIGIAYCDEVKNLEDVLDDSIARNEKIKFLENIKESPSSFSDEDFETMNEILKKKDKLMKRLVLEILLKDDVEWFPIILKNTIFEEFIVGDNTDYSMANFLPLRVLIKGNTIEGTLNDRFIFLPFWQPRKDEEDLLYDYEKYMVENLKYMSEKGEGDFFKECIEKMFFSSQYKEFKTKYIEAMFFFDMSNVLIKIILNNDIDIDLRKQAIRVCLKLLPHSCSYETFNENFLEALSKISENSEEKKELREFADYISVLVRQKQISLKDFNNVAMCTKFFTL